MRSRLTVQVSDFYYDVTKKPEWRNWYTHQTQNLARFTPHVGSSPTSGTKHLHKKFHPLIWLFVIALIALYVQAWSQTQIRLTDFSAFYASGRLLWVGENPYD